MLNLVWSIHNKFTFFTSVILLYHNNSYKPTRLFKIMTKSMSQDELEALVGKEFLFSFTVVSNKNRIEERTAIGILDRSTDVSQYGYRIRFQDIIRKGNIGMIFPLQDSKSALYKDEINHLSQNSKNLRLVHAVGKCPGQDGCCQPWNNYLRYFAA